MNKEVQKVLSVENENKVLCNINGEVIYDESVKLKDDRIAALEKVVREFLNNLERSGFNTSICSACCPYCDADADFTAPPLVFLPIEHKPDCLFIKARAVLEGK